MNIEAIKYEYRGYKVWIYRLKSMNIEAKKNEYRGYKVWIYRLKSMNMEANKYADEHCTDFYLKCDWLHMPEWITFREIVSATIINKQYQHIASYVKYVMRVIRELCIKKVLKFQTESYVQLASFFY